MPTTKKSPTLTVKPLAKLARGPQPRPLSWHINLEPATVKGLESHARRLGIPVELLVSTGLRAWKGALSEEKNCGLTFPVKLATKLPGED